MPHYLLSVCYPQGAAPPGRDELAQIMADLDALNADLRSAGAWVYAAGYADPFAAHVVTSEAGGPAVSEGAFLETSGGMIGGFSIIAADDHDDAVRWAARMSTATTTPVEVRALAG
jgi:hypothetical protein